MALKLKNYKRLKADLFDVFVNEFESNKGHYSEEKKEADKMNATHKYLQKLITHNGYRREKSNRDIDEKTARVSEGYPS